MKGGDNINRLGRSIKEKRKEKGLTQKELGVLIGVAESTISCYELGKRHPDVDTIINIADALGADYGQLLGITIKEELPWETNIMLGLSQALKDKGRFKEALSYQLYLLGDHPDAKKIKELLEE